jgi:hypothetical protein
VSPRGRSAGRRVVAADLRSRAGGELARPGPARRLVAAPASPAVAAAFEAFARAERELVAVLERRVGEDEALLAEIRAAAAGRVRNGARAGRRGSSEDDLPLRLNHAQDRGDGRGLNPAPDEHGPAVLSMHH